MGVVGFGETNCNLSGLLLQFQLEQEYDSNMTHEKIQQNDNVQIQQHDTGTNTAT